MKNSHVFLKTLALFSLAVLSSDRLLAEAYPSGAAPSACTTMEPVHGANKPSTQLSPYVILVSKNTYSPGEDITVMLRGLCGTKFKGFLVQARRADREDPRYTSNPSQAIGQFKAVIGSQYVCGNGRIALTHDGRYNATTLLFNWTAPAQSQGHVQIKATVVQEFGAIWTSVASVVVEDPLSTALPVNADSLRSKFIEPCEIDRPKARTTPAPVLTVPETTTTTTTTTTPTTTTTSPATTTPSSLPSVSTTTMPPTRTTSTEAPSRTLPNFEITTTIPRNLPVEEAAIECGKTHGCFRQCTNPQICQFRVAWQPRNETVWFDVMVPPLENVDDQWLALAFSEDHKMGQDSVVECMKDNSLVKTHLSFNGGRENDILSDAESEEMISKVTMSNEDGYLHCQFQRKTNVTGQMRAYDLEKDWYLLLAQGAVRQGRKERHAAIPVASARLVDLQALEDIGPWVQDKIFIKLHASMMAFAWIFCAGFGIVMARYYKQLWPKHKLCGRKVWYTIHRGCMILLGVLMVAGFIIIFVEAKGLADISVKEFQKLHPVVGMIVVLFTIIQIGFGIFRPSSSSSNRPVFNWGHWLLGASCYILSVFNMGLGLKLRKSGTHNSASYVLYSYAIYQICMIVCLEIISCNIRMKEKKTASYVIYERRNTIYSSAKEIMEGNSDEPPGSIALRIAIFVHLLFVTSFTAALIALVAVE